MIRRRRLGTRVSVLLVNDPVRLAEDMAELDLLSHGGVCFGTGRGYQPHEFASYHIPMEVEGGFISDWQLISTGNPPMTSCCPRSCIAVANALRTPRRCWPGTRTCSRPPTNDWRSAVL